VARLKAIPPRLQTTKPRLVRADASGHDKTAEPFRPLYKTARWSRLRWQVLTRDLFTCQMCRRVEADTSKLVCDHIIRHEHKDLALFWDENNLQALCAPCHSKHKQKLEKSGRFR
jgi:5-methylcytosine-specific restriction endonuclease McrA